MAAQGSLKCWAALLLVVCYLLSCAGRGGAAATGGVRRRQQLEVRRRLNELNKPAVKSIKSPDGDVIDCVHVSLQPAFDHPLLRNHTIQIRPSFHPEGPYADNKLESKLSSVGLQEKSRGSISQLWHLNGRCPENTIPIRRIKGEDILRASSIKGFGKKKHKTMPFPLSAKIDLVNQNGHQHAIAYVEGDGYYGAKATMNVWNPLIQLPNEFSLSQIWLLGGSFGEDLNSIEAGWQSDAYQATGCYNLLCSGFIQLNNQIAMGASIYPISGYGSSQYDIKILVWKDPKEGNWWMQFGEDHVLGYWPSFLFSYLSESASMVEWGGEIVNSEPDGQHTSTQMGSGHFPEEGFGKASYFRNIQIVDSSNNLRDPKGLGTFTEQSSCYNAQNDQNGDWGNYFYYGGPGKNPNCP
ncbi:hypothetical protein AXF42_Ash001518 [Apostasia shenzhenica]|uniref:Neprosin PEP catalytic domain-containing protein n=1 Tax=Apostasia shenzhenica TaxID=1088818 RepID=A0A2I0AAG9_9ASPA|nr:hypothetical protein AXF42_Ash001518 [Apostasia shenzhenica]